MNDTRTVQQTKPCRTCSECDGHHHWIEMCEEEEGAFVGFQCKHCPMRSELCEGCDQPVYPSPAGAEYCPACVKDFS
jgi:hypothetical protein